MDDLLVLCAGLLVLSYSLTHLFRNLALALQIVDRPNHRSAHAKDTPTGAGLVFIALFSAGLFLLAMGGLATEVSSRFLQLLPAFLLVAAISAVDDFKPLPWWPRLLCHLAAALWVVALVGFPLLQVADEMFDAGPFGLVLGGMLLVFLPNAYNFMDGIDGIAAGEAVLILVFALLLSGLLGSGFQLGSGFLTSSGAEVGAILMAVLVGFLVINWPNARVFMGDVGSSFLGLFFGAAVLSELLVPVWTWLILLGWFLVDTTVTLLRRLLRGDRLYEPHSMHAYQHLNRAVGTPKTLMIIAAVNTFWLLPFAAGSMLYSGYGAILVVLALLPLAIYLAYLGAGTPPKLTTD